MEVYALSQKRAYQIAKHVNRQLDSIAAAFSPLADCGDMELITHIAEGNERALEIFVARFRGLIAAAGRAALSNPDSYALDEITQNTLLKILSAARTHPPHTSVRGWVYRIAVQQTISYARTRQRLTRSLVSADTHRENKNGESVPLQFPDVRLMPDAALIASESFDIDTLPALVESLPAEYRTAIQLYYFDGLRMAEIAERQHIDISSVSRHITWGLRMLRGILTGKPVRPAESGPRKRVIA